MSQNGWWIQIVGTTEANEIGIQTGPSRDDNDCWGTWRRGESTEVPIREKDQGYNKLFIQLNNPEEKQVYANVMYGSRLLQKYSFDGTHENHHVDRR